MFDSFKKNKIKTESLCSIMNGLICDVSKTPDVAFAQKMLGDGYVIFPPDNKKIIDIVSPVDGEVSVITDTKHAIGIVTNDKYELLIHMGIDTVNLKGEGFEIFISEGEKVLKGQKIASMNIEVVLANGYKTATPVVISNLSPNTKIKLNEQEVNAGDEVVEIC